MVRIYRFFCLLILFPIFSSCTAATISEGDRQVLKMFWEYAEKNKLSDLPVKERIPIIGKFFIGKPYKSGTLNVTKKELPVINLRELDCVTLVENTLALAFLDHYDNTAISQFTDNIIKLRYRDGEIVDYTSRLHYSSDWLYEMGRQQFLTDVTQNIGGEIFPQDICFMSENYTKYNVLVQDKKLIPKIKDIETAINKRTYYYIPKGKINEANGKILEGDVVLITTNIKGLDTSHLGFALKRGGKTYLLHASSSGKKVVITEVPLQDYMMNIKTQTGIMVGRVVK